jgi:predicted Rossmann fold flavoprotein
MFPVTDSSETIIDCFLSEAARLGIRIELNSEVVGVRKGADGLFNLNVATGRVYTGLHVLVTTGGSPKGEAYSFIEQLGHHIKPLIPSLFTFNDKERWISDLMGVSVSEAEVRIVATKFKQRGPLLITHWGLSGPAVIRLSAWAAEYLHSVGYDFRILVSWIGHANEEEIRNFLLTQKDVHGKRRIHGHPLFGLPQRLWVRLCTLAEIQEEKIWGELAHRNLNKLLEHLIRCTFHIRGKTTFKEEFVTCGGVDLQEVDLHTMESKLVKGLYFAGEVLNIDGETGGFNFQAAWSTAFVAARSALASENIFIKNAETR